MTTPTIEELLDKARFEAWLRDRNPSANVGESGSYCDCPLATYLRSNGWPDAEVWCSPHGDVRIKSGGSYLAWRAPWVQHFVKLVDGLRDSKGEIRDHVKVRAYQAWAILGRIG